MEEIMNTLKNIDIFILFDYYHRDRKIAIFNNNQYYNNETLRYETHIHHRSII